MTSPSVEVLLKEANDRLRELAARDMTELTVLLGERSLERICELSSGEVLTPGEVLPLLLDADVERVVFDVPAERCEIDHVVPYEAGGETTQANGTCRCPFHHRWRHRHESPSELAAA